MPFGWKKKPLEGKTTSGDVVTSVAPERGAEDTKGDGKPLATTVSAASMGQSHEYPTGLRLVLLMLSVFVSMFLVALDRLIITTAIPKITDEFDSLGDVGWYGSAYLLTTCSFQLMCGKLYSFFSIKFVFLAAVALFEIGSAICGAAPSSIVFIVGRAIAGVGAAGIFSGLIVIIVYAVPLHKRPMYQGLFGAVFGLASVIGPLVGGALTSKVTWRWCFYINLPFGAVAIAIIAFLLKIPDRKETSLPTREKLAQLDFAGTSVIIPGVICLLLALQWGGTTYAWSDGRIVACMTLGCVLLVAFVAIQVLMPKTATIPPRIFKQRSILAGFWATICIGSQMMIFVYYLPIWFQAIKGVSAVDSGIRLLPMTLSMVVASMVSGILTSKVGYYTPFMIMGTCIMATGAGLLTTLQVNTGEGQWIGYQILYGFGMGLTFQSPNLAAQTVLSAKDVPIGTSLMFFSQLLGGAVFISVGQNVLSNQLLQRLSAVPGFNTGALGNAGATDLINSLPESQRAPVREAYNEALRQVFYIGLALTCLIIIGSASMEWKSVKKNKDQGAAAAVADAERGADGASAPRKQLQEHKSSGTGAVDEEEAKSDPGTTTAAETTSETEIEAAADEKRRAEVEAVKANGALAETALAAEPVPTGIVKAAEA